MHADAGPPWTWRQGYPSEARAISVSDFASVLSRPRCQKRFDHRVELSGAARMKIMTTVHRDIAGVGYPPGELGQSVLTEMAVGAPDNQGGAADPLGHWPPTARWTVPPPLDLAGGAPVVGLSPPRTPRHFERRIGRVGRGHLLQHQGPNQVRAGGGKQERDQRPVRMTERNDAVEAEGVQQSYDIVAHQFKAVLPRPTALPVATKIGSHDAEPLAHQRREVPPVSPRGRETVQQQHDSAIGSAPLTVGERRPARQGHGLRHRAEASENAQLRTEPTLPAPQQSHGVHVRMARLKRFMRVRDEQATAGTP